MLQGFFTVEKMGLEPTTFWLPAKRSSQLSYIPRADANIQQFLFKMQAALRK